MQKENLKTQLNTILPEKIQAVEAKMFNIVQNTNSQKTQPPHFTTSRENWGQQHFPFC